MSHSALSDMKVISQDEPSKNRDESRVDKLSKGSSSMFERSAIDDDEEEDDEYIVKSFRGLGFGGPPKYSDSPFSRNVKNSGSSSNNNNNNNDSNNSGSEFMLSCSERFQFVFTRKYSEGFRSIIVLIYSLC